MALEIKRIVNEPMGANCYILYNLEHIGKFFTNIFNGCRDYSNLSPQKYRSGVMPIVNKKLNF